MSTQTYKLTSVSVQWTKECEYRNLNSLYRISWLSFGPLTKWNKGEVGPFVFNTFCVRCVCRPGASNWWWGRRAEAPWAASRASGQHQFSGLHCLLQCPCFSGRPSGAIWSYQTAEGYHRAWHRTVSLLPTLLKINIWYFLFPPIRFSFTYWI